jgi:hypothetical protein
VQRRFVVNAHSEFRLGTARCFELLEPEQHDLPSVALAPPARVHSDVADSSRCWTEVQDADFLLALASEIECLHRIAHRQKMVWQMAEVSEFPFHDGVFGSRKDSINNSARSVRYRNRI